MPDLDAVLANDQTNLRTLISSAKEQGPIGTKPIAVNGQVRVIGNAAAVGQPESRVVNLLDTYVSKNGEMAFRPSRRNAYLVLCNDTRVRGKIWHDDFKGALMRSQEEYKDTDDTKLQMWLEGIYGMRMSTGTVSEVTRLVGEEFARNPLHEYLESCQWDGVPRIDHWLVRGAGALDTPLVRSVGKRWLISAVARAIQPGCKADTVLIFVGPQGAKKSTCFRALSGDEYFCDTPMDIGSPNAYTQIRRAWIYEVAELDSIRRSANSATKAFLTAQEDTYRPAYGRHAVTTKRHCIFCGTTNEQSFISDMTGSRRFWPVRVGVVDLQWIKDNRDQLWAEAMAAYKAGEIWWLENESETELQRVSEDYRQIDPWQPMIEEWLLNKTDVTVTDVMQGGLKLEPNQMTKLAQMRVSDILRHIGLVRVRKTIYGNRCYVWQKENVTSSDEIHDSDTF